MRILVINSSPRRGNTWRLTEKVMEQIKGLDNTVKFEEIHLSECKIPYCTGCSVCFRKGHIFCPHNQYIQPIMDKIAESDEAFLMDLKSKRLHSPKIGVLIPFNLFQAMSEDYAPGTEYETLDGVFWKPKMIVTYKK